MGKTGREDETRLPQLVKIDEAARILGRPVATLRYWRAAGKGPRVVKTEGRIGYDVADLQAYINANREAANRDAVSSVRAT